MLTLFQGNVANVTKSRSPCLFRLDKEKHKKVDSWTVYFKQVAKANKTKKIGLNSFNDTYKITKTEGWWGEERGQYQYIYLSTSYKVVK